MNYEAFRSELAAGVLHPVYCFMGAEEYLIEEGCEALIKTILPDSGRQFCLVEVEAGAQPDEIKRALRSPSFFGAKRVVRLRGPDKLSTEALEALAANLGAIPPGTHLVVAGAPDRKRRAGRELLAAAAVVECPELRKNEAVAWICSRAESMRVRLRTEAARLLVETVGPRLRALAIELEKALAYLGGERDEITAADLAALLGADREENVFKLVEAAAAGRREEALRTLADLLAQGEPEARLLVMLARQARLIMLAGHYRRAGLRTPEIAGKLGIPVFAAEKLVAQSAGLSFDRCREMLHRMLLADVRGKTGERDPRVELELAVLDMTGSG